MIADFLASTGGIAVKAALVAAFLDFAVGSFMAASHGSFALDAIGAFIRKHLLGRVLPLSLLVLVGYLTGDLAINSAAAGALTVYAIETMASIRASITESKAIAVETIPND